MNLGQVFFVKNQKPYFYVRLGQGILNEGKGLVQITSNLLLQISLDLQVLILKIYIYFWTKQIIWMKRSTFCPSQGTFTERVDLSVRLNSFIQFV